MYTYCWSVIFFYVYKKHSPRFLITSFVQTIRASLSLRILCCWLLFPQFTEEYSSRTDMHVFAVRVFIYTNQLTFYTCESISPAYIRYSWRCGGFTRVVLVPRFLFKNFFSILSACCWVFRSWLKNSLSYMKYSKSH